MVSVATCTHSSRLFLFNLLFVNSALRTSGRRQREPAEGVPERRIVAHDWTPGPAGVQPLNNRPAEQDVYPRIQDLVAGGEPQPEQKVLHMELSTGQHGLRNKYLVEERLRPETKDRRWCWNDTLEIGGQRQKKTGKGGRKDVIEKGQRKDN